MSLFERLIRNHPLANIAFAVVLSVFNAVTFTPALSALLLDKEPHAHGFFFRFVNRVIDGGTRLYVRCVRFTLNWRVVFMLLFAGSMYATWWVYKAVPGAFVPAEDEGYFITHSHSSILMSLIFFLNCLNINIIY